MAVYETTIAYLISHKTDALIKQEMFLFNDTLNTF